MKIAIIGSRNIKNISLLSYLENVSGITEIVSGGAKGVDTLAEELSKRLRIKLTVFLPNYERFGRAAPIVRNKKIVEYSDIVFAFWDGKSKGTLSVIEYCKKINKPCKVFKIENQ